MLICISHANFLHIISKQLTGFRDISLASLRILHMFNSHENNSISEREEIKRLTFTFFDKTRSNFGEKGSTSMFQEIKIFLFIYFKQTLKYQFTDTTCFRK